MTFAAKPVSPPASDPDVDEQGPVPQPQRLLEDGAARYAADQIQVKFRPDVDFPTRHNILKNNGLSPLHRLRMLDWYVVSVPQGVDPRTAVAVLKALPEVESATLNPLLKPQTNDTYWSQQWALASNRLNVEQAWSIWPNSEIYQNWIAILDSGLDMQIMNSGAIDPSNSHPDLFPTFGDSKVAIDPVYGTIAQWEDVTHPRQWSGDVSGHGTSVAGAAAAATGNAEGIAGIAPTSLILPINVVYSDGSFTEATEAAAVNDILDELHYPQWDKRVKVINISAGWTPGSTGEDCLSEAIAKAAHLGILTVASAGNDPTAGSVFLPAGFWNVMTVAATTYQDQVAAYSARASYLSVAAPSGQWLPDGEGYPTYLVENRINWTSDRYPEVMANRGPLGNPPYGTGTGTSISAPEVAGVAAGLISEFPSMTGEDVQYHIEDTSDNIGYTSFPNTDIGWGRVNAGAAAYAPGNSWTPPTYPAGGQLVCVPYWKPGLDPQSRDNDFNALFPGANITDVIWWDPTANGGSGGFVSYLPNEPNYPYGGSNLPRLGPGKAFWVYFPTAYTPSATFTGATPYQGTTAKQGHPFPVHLMPGWNYVGCPGLNGVVWDTSTLQVRYPGGANHTVLQVPLSEATTIVNPTSTDQNGIPATSWTPGWGYRVYAYQECDLLFPG